MNKEPQGLSEIAALAGRCLEDSLQFFDNDSVSLSTEGQAHKMYHSVGCFKTKFILF